MSQRAVRFRVPLRASPLEADGSTGRRQLGAQPLGTSAKLAGRICLVGDARPIPVPRSLSEKQVMIDKDLRQAAAERFFVFPGIPHFVPSVEIRKSLL